MYVRKTAKNPQMQTTETWNNHSSLPVILWRCGTGNSREPFIVDRCLQISHVSSIKAKKRALSPIV